MNIFKKINYVGTVFMGGVKSQLKQQWSWQVAGSVGLHQGLKYKGSMKTGIYGGLATLAVIAGANGVCNVMEQWDKIKVILKEE